MGIVIIVGNYGSGKTEIAINLAVHQKISGTNVNIGDLDLVNPYFRTREAKDALSRLNIEVIVPGGQYLQSDLPILSPTIKGMLLKPGQLFILDVGGNHVGARVLSALYDALCNKSFKLLQVVNPFRPFTRTINDCDKIRRDIERASRQNINGIIGNANLIHETTPEIIYSGYQFIDHLCNEWDLSLEFITVPRPILNDIDMNRISCPVLPIERQLVPPWHKPTPLGHKNFILH